MSGNRLLKVRVSLKGRPVRSYRFKKETISVGRNPDADIHLDNPGISREHLNLVQMPDGSYAAQDLGSANGTFVNDVKITRQYLSNEDVIRIGKFSLWVNYEEDRRTVGAEPKLSPVAFDGTTVLKTSELEEMMESARETELAPPPSLSEVPKLEIATRNQSGRRGVLTTFGIVLVFILGYVCGAWGLYVWIMAQRTG